jgi:hypothetical protein
LHELFPTLNEINLEIIYYIILLDFNISSIY